MEIRPYHVSDADTVSAFLTDAARLDDTLKPCGSAEWRGYVARSFNDRGRRFAVVEVGRRVVGLLMRSRTTSDAGLTGSARIIVDPRFRRRGIARRLADLVDEDAVAVTCLGRWTAGQRLLERRGFRPGRVQLTMQRATAGLGAPGTSPVSIRAARDDPTDDQTWLRLNAEGYASGPAYTPLGAPDIAIHRADPGFRLWIAEFAGQAVGLCHVVRFAGEPWVNSVVVSEAHRNRGVGRALMGSALAALASAGIGRVNLSVRAENEPAAQLYRSLGFQITESEAIWSRRAPDQTAVSVGTPT